MQHLCNSYAMVIKSKKWYVQYNMHKYALDKCMKNKTMLINYTS